MAKKNDAEIKEKKEQDKNHKKATHHSDKKEKNTKEEKNTDKSKKETSNEKDILNKKNEELQNELDEWKDKYIRLAAEFDNYRKRTLNEKMELTKTAAKDILYDFLFIMDDFDRAIDSMESIEDNESLKAGVDLIYNKCLSFLQKNGVKEIDAKGKEFNTDEHEAMTKIEAPNEEMKGKVVDVIQKGYYLNDNILRYAKVVVGE